MNEMAGVIVEEGEMQYDKCHCCGSRLEVITEYEQPPGADRPVGLAAVDAEDIKAQLRRLIRERDEAKEALAVAMDMSGSFFLALKPLNLPGIYVANPGQHVTELIAERDELRAQLAALRAAAGESA